MLDFSNASFFAKKFWGPDKDLIISKSLGGGLANQGIFKHELSSGSVFVEKRTTRLNEILFAQSAISKQNFSGETLPTMPQLFDLIQNKNGYTIFMENLNPLNSGFVDTRNAAKNIAHLINNLHKDLEQINNSAIEAELDESGYLNFLIEVFPKKYYKERKMLIRIKNRFEQEKKILSHNDLFFPNICHRGNSVKNLVAIDFGLVGFNIPGAELHHFLDRTPEKFFNSLIKEYTSVSGLDEKLLVAGAIIYSGFRNFDRSKKNKSLDERFRELKKSIILANNILVV